MSENQLYSLVSKSYSVVYSKRILFPVIGLTLLAFLFSLWNRCIYIDDAFFGEQAYWLAKCGTVKVSSMLDFLGCEKNLFSYHKLNIFMGAGLIKIFGWHLTPLRSISILFFLGLVWMLVKYCKQFPEIFTRQHILIAVFILFCNPLIVLYAFTFRPEIWVTFFGFISFFYIDKTIRNSSVRIFSVFAGIFAGLAFLTHLNGLIFPLAGFISLLVFKRYKELFWFTLSGGIVGLFYFWDLWQNNHFEMWLFQLKFWPDNNATSYMSGSFLHFIRNVYVKLCSEHQRFFWSDKVWGISAFFLLCFFSNLKFLFRQHRLLFIYTIVLILALNIAGGQIAERFLIYFFPFFALIIALSVVRLMNDKKIALKIFLILLFVLQLGFTSKMFSFIIRSRNDFRTNHSEIFSKISEKKALVLVPYELVYNGLETYNLASFKGFEYFEALKKHHLTQTEFFSRADSLKIKYIVFPSDKGRFHYFTIPCFNNKEIEKNPYYSKYYCGQQAIILKSNSN
jgi:hypothetical protein